MRIGTLGFVALLSLTAALPGCGASVDDGTGSAEGDTSSTPGPDEEVGDVSQALGGFTYKFRTSDPLVPLHLGSSVAIYAEHGCVDHVLFVVRTTGAEWPAFFGSCKRPTAVGSDANGTFVGDAESNDILSYVNGPLFPVWVKIADTSGDPRGRILLNGTHAFWADDAGIKRVARGGGAVTTVLATTQGARLEALDGSTIYFSVWNADSKRNLRRVSTSGSGNTNLYTATFNLTQVSVDATHVYFVEEDTTPLGTLPPETSRIRRLHKSSLDVTTMWDHGDSRYYQHPITHGGALYWVESRNWDSFGGDLFMRRKNLSNGNVVTVEYGHAPWVWHMGIFSDGIYTASFAQLDGAPTTYLRRGDF